MTETGVALPGVTKRFGSLLALDGTACGCPPVSVPLAVRRLPPDGLTGGQRP